MLPNIEDMIGIDLETYDPNLEAKGPGTFRNDGFVVGVAIKRHGRSAEYIPIGHATGKNWTKVSAIRYIKELCCNDQPKLGARLLYDLEWLHWLGVPWIGGLKVDVQVIEPLIDENQFKYNLESLGQQYVGEGKSNQQLIDYCRQLGYHIKKDKDLFKYLYKLPPEIVAPYPIQDVELPFKIYAKQKVILKRDNLEEVFMLESRLTDPLLKMRIDGVPVDLDKADQVRTKLIKEEQRLERELTKIAGGPIDIWTATSVAVAFDRAGINYPRTPKTNAPSFTAPWLDVHPSSLAKTLVTLRKTTKMRKDFIESMIIGSAINGRIHAQFHQVKHDEGGTVSGRFSSDKPNLQQVPARDPIYAPLVRGIFVPDKGAKWNKRDYSQQEPRLTVHYANVKKFKGANIAAQRYITDPDTDYHQMVADLCEIDRRPAKDINLGLAYGMGVAKMAVKLGKTEQETRVLFQKYHERVPFVKMLSDNCMNLASTRGYIRTIAGRRRHFNLWGRPKWKEGDKYLPYDEAVNAYGLPLRRAFTHKALNSLIQGSAADMIKQALLDTYDAGYTIYLTVHDEINGPVTSMRQVKEQVDIMINAIKLNVPLKVDSFVKTNWGDCHD